MSSSPRHHIVLVPGFTGFDALGQVDYHTGVSARIQDWQLLHSESQPPMEIHYFDNLPSASVSTRANRLLAFLAKRVARREFGLAPGWSYDDRKKDDQVFLVGYSTGGLDIRRLLFDLQKLESRREPVVVDGDEVKVDAAQILRLVAGVVFLSVPQYGTNIADWAISHPIERQFIAAWCKYRRDVE